MSASDILARIERKLGKRLLDSEVKSPRRVYIEVSAGDIVAASRMMFKSLGARFQIATGVDTPDAIEVLYHWALDPSDCVVTVRTHLERDCPEIDSIAGICPAAEWIEREMWELLGIDFKGHPDLRHLLLDDDWPEGKYPLRRDYVKE